MDALPPHSSSTDRRTGAAPRTIAEALGETPAQTTARVAEALSFLEEACLAITKASCRLGASEGDYDFQMLWHAVAKARREALFLLAVRSAHQKRTPEAAE